MQPDDRPEQIASPQRTRDWAGLSAFTKQSLIATTQTFVAPTVAAGFLPPQYRSLAFVAAGAVLGARRALPSSKGFAPPLSPLGNVVVAGVGFSPFLLFLPLHAHWAQRDTSAGKKVREAWATVTQKLRGPFGQRLRQYPVNFVFVRATAQLGASALGAPLAYAYATASDDRRFKPVDQAIGPPPSTSPPAQAIATGAAMFSVPAALAVPAVWKKVCFGRPTSPATTTAVITASLIAAALGTIAAVQPSR